MGVERLEQQKSLFPTRTQRERIPKRVSDKAERFGSAQRLVSREKLPLSRKSGQVGEEINVNPGMHVIRRANQLHNKSKQLLSHFFLFLS